MPAGTVARAPTVPALSEPRSRKPRSDGGIGGFGVEDVARGIADKLVARHPYVFASGEVPSDLNFTWEQVKAAEKGRSSVLQGIPDQPSALARVQQDHQPQPVAPGGDDPADENTN